MSARAEEQKAEARALIGRRILGSYEIADVLGTGAMGAVYLARQTSIEQEIAVKVLHGDAATDQEVTARFNREARVISMLTHPNIIRVLVFGQMEDGKQYMAMEYVEGRSLREELGAGSMDELAIIKIMKQVLSALAEAHDLGIIHRDLKPENILLTRFRGESNFVKILDFGIAKILEPDGPQKELTQAGIVYGTPEYISPEQAQAIDIDNRTDIYALGCVLYEMATGRVPFDARSALKVLQMQAFEEPPPPRDINPDVPRALEAIIAKAMSKDPSERYQSALEMFYALEGREQKILKERSLDRTANLVPGSEITGIFSVVRQDPSALVESATAPDARPLLIVAIAFAVLSCLLFFVLILAVIFG